jgi:hypothetical protein
MTLVPAAESGNGYEINGFQCNLLKPPGYYDLLRYISLKLNFSGKRAPTPL